MKTTFFILLTFLALMLLSCKEEKVNKQYDPVTMDPVAEDTVYPPSMAPFIVNSGGSNINAIIYTTQGKGPHPTVILLHGFPGNEKNLDLAQAIRRAGWNVVFFHYRGSWGSQGNFSLDNCLEDVTAILKFLKEDTNISNFRIERSKIVLIGHSMGGYMALGTIIDNPDILGAVWIAGGNISEFGKWASENQKNQALYRKYIKESSAALNGIDIEYLVQDVMNNQSKWDLRSHAEILAQKKLLMIGASYDTEVPLNMHYKPLVEKLKSLNAEGLSAVVLNTDHSFSNKRIELTGIIVAWLKDFIQ